ncbi:MULTISPECIES: DmpA family aminopeptidase [Burkholderia]|uniref:DmpA family aminopeptidase n=1 Tax=Burkholderia TaxID=32008 RepID=UPI0008A3EED0|nr:MULTISPECIES: P1 family peptidase [Burkholderia]MBJ9680375.1 P1 family peptidase [Burkholderia multivorans]MDR9034210.1 Beta-peptidyl aminopeptidase BapA [Burkholderia multivorans]MDR9041214.1 Beta-peptidyl aminopeptidase BapA [Burkholderia multivorans]MDR9084371.1 Beta-peptidyl aminopeptidase BapA [Burkholderia multivorans]MDR9112671.1 Beta-peptidyl aminopeptidase BapA [Burkholderia multivorans]
MRTRDLGIRIGLGTPGRFNAITDVPGVRVGHCTLNVDDGDASVRTGVTVIEPRAGAAHASPCFAGVHVLNGNGDATGLEWIREAGLLTTPIAYTNTHSVGAVRDALVANERDAARGRVYWCMPVVMETYDGLLNDIWGQHVDASHVRAALAAARSGPVDEGGVGGGTGMICHEFKGGIGTASRVLAANVGGWTVGALVQANYGVREMLRVAGYPVGDVLRHVHSPFRAPQAQGEAGMGSIVVTLATDAPLLPHQCTRLAQRASVGLARVGGGTEDSSGDIFLAFATGNDGLPAADYGSKGAATTNVKMVNNDHISALFAAAAEAVEEAIVNALVAAGDVESRGARVEAIGHGRLLDALREVGWRPGHSV